MDTQTVTNTTALDDSQASISAYYSLVFPNFTYFLQTLNVTIGRRCSPVTADTASTSTEKNPVDVDLGPLKSVSRLHAKIEYEEDDERFVLVVVGRNGAWVDGVWSGSGSRVPLSERSQIQIASRTFHFVLPPPPPLPEDSPSPSDEADEIGRPRSPSLDIISHSPPSSLTSHSPPPPAPAPVTRPTAPPKPKASSKKRKKSDHAPPPKLPKPDVMPPKPQLTYSIMCYRAINTLGGKATLQDICGWMRDTFDWYKYNDEAGWENSVRHNLSSNRAFKKMERCAGERGKGFFWSVDENFVATFEEQEARNAQLQQGGSPPQGNGVRGIGKNKKGAPLSEPPLKRSVKAGSGPLPPPLTTTPLLMKSTIHPNPTIAPSPYSSYPPLSRHTQPLPAMNVTPFANAIAITSTNTTGTIAIKSGFPTPPPPRTSATTDTATNAVARSTSFISSLPPSVCIPIIIGTPPASAITSTSTASSTTHLPTPPIVLHENTLILNPAVFSHLTTEQLKELEALGAQKALEILQSYIVRFLKERIRGEKDGARGGRGRGRGRPKRGNGPSGPGRGGASMKIDGAPPHQPTTGDVSAIQLQSSPSVDGVADVKPLASSLMAPPPTTPTHHPPMGHTSSSPIIVVDDIDGDADTDEQEGPALKKRRLDGSGTAITT